MSSELEHAYQLLEVSPDVTDKEMRSAWRRLVRRYHPDLCKTDPEEASRRMADINAAFDALALHRAKKEEVATKPTRKPDRAPRRKPQPRTTQRTARPTPKAPPEAPKQHAKAPKAAKTWSREEQTLVNAASSLFEETRRKLSQAARNPVFSVCH
jgi:curved DNA-binding protein CbpA